MDEKSLIGGPGQHASRTPLSRLLENSPSHPRKCRYFWDGLSPATTVHYLDTMYDATPGVLRGSIDRGPPNLLTAVHPNNALCSITSKRWTRNSSTSDNFLSLLPSTTPQPSNWSRGLNAAMTVLKAKKTTPTFGKSQSGVVVEAPLIISTFSVHLNSQIRSFTESPRLTSNFNFY